jgi:TctA family transporter
MLLSAYSVNKIISSEAIKGRGLRSYVKLFLLGYILKKLSFKIVKIIFGLLLGAITMYLFKKYSAKEAVNKIEIQ